MDKKYAMKKSNQLPLIEKNGQNRLFGVTGEPALPLVQKLTWYPKKSKVFFMFYNFLFHRELDTSYCLLA